MSKANDKFVSTLIKSLDTDYEHWKISSYGVTHTESGIVLSSWGTKVSDPTEYKFSWKQRRKVRAAYRRCLAKIMTSQLVATINQGQGENNGS